MGRKQPSGGPDHLAGFPADQQFFEVRQIAALLNVVPKTVRRWLRDDLLAGRKIGGKFKVTRRDLLTFIDTPQK